MHEPKKWKNRELNSCVFLSIVNNNAFILFEWLHEIIKNLEPPLASFTKLQVMNECSQEQKFTNEDKIIISYYICAMTCFNSVFLKAYKKQELSSNLHTVYKSSLPLKKH